MIILHKEFLNKTNGLPANSQACKRNPEVNASKTLKTKPLTLTVTSNGYCFPQFYKNSSGKHLPSTQEVNNEKIRFKLFKTSQTFPVLDQSCMLMVSMVKQPAFPWVVGWEKGGMNGRRCHL